MKIPKVGTRVIRVSGCHDCPSAKWIPFYPPGLDDHEVECLVMEPEEDSDVTKYYDTKTLPDDCPLEEVNYVVPKFKNNDCDIEGYILKERYSSEK